MTKRFLLSLFSVALLSALTTSCEEDLTDDLEIEDEVIEDTTFPDEDLEDLDYEALTDKLYEDLEQVPLTGGNVEAAGYIDSYVTLKNSTGLTLTGDVATLEAALSGSVINIKDSDSRVFLPGVTRDELAASTTLLEHFLVSGRGFIEDYTISVGKYYRGVYLSAVDPDFAPAIVYAGEESAPLERSTIYTGENENIPLGENTIDKILLKRGYQIVVAASSDGTVSSRCFIAIENDLLIELDETLSGQVSFMRCLASGYNTKRGIGGKSYGSFVPPFDLCWHYTWQVTPQNYTYPIVGAPDQKFVPMLWSKSNVTESSFNTVIENEFPLLMFLNEPENSQQGNTVVATAIELYSSLHKLGVRLGAPSMEQINDWTSTTTSTTNSIGWITTFMEGVLAAGLRVDVMGAHWYDVGYGTNGTGAASASSTRLMTSMATCYKKWGRPIMIMEVNNAGNGSVNKDWDVCAAWMGYAIPKMETCEYIEGYALFPPTSAIGGMVSGSSYNTYGLAYTAYESTPAIVMCDDSRNIETDSDDDDDTETDE